MNRPISFRVIATVLAVLVVTAGVTVVIAFSAGMGGAGAEDVSGSGRPGPDHGTSRTESAASLSPAAATEGVSTPPGRPCLRVGYGAPWDWSVMGQDELDRTMQGAAGAGGGVVRVGIEWDRVEARRGVRDWSVPDRLVRTARAHGLEVIALLIGTPGWARDAAGPADSPMTPPADPVEFGRFAEAAAGRYTDGVIAWEVWNEPNLEDFWRTGADPTAYTRLLAEAHRGIDRVSPDTPVLSGGLGPSGTHDGYMAPNDFLRAMYDAGARGSFDGYGLHPYSYPQSPADPAKPWSPWLHMFDARRILTAHGDGAVDIWITEFGAPTGHADKAVSVGDQARILSDGIREASRIPWIRALIVYTLRDGGDDSLDREDNFGVVSRDWRRKPAAGAVAEAAARYGCPS